ncbi:MAG: type III-B CRISPR-associated protein Cas10/Cmr2 [Magnetococcus sp. DMHC-6]
MADPGVLDAEKAKEYQEKKQQYRIADGEHLDAIGLIKRTGGTPGQFVPLANVALAEWIAVAKQAEIATQKFNVLEDACQRAGVERIVRDDILWTTYFPYDAQVFFKDRWQPILKEAGCSDKHHEWGKSNVIPILKWMNDPDPYLACLVADGDRMGDALNKIGDPEEHQLFSNKLSNFATSARQIVHEHYGLLIYSGGDDVLAFVCLTKALACAQALRDKFEECMTEALPGVEVLPTLSVGLGVGHTLADMRELLTLGRRAEQLAKGKEIPDETKQRNALAIIVDKRSGQQRYWRQQWHHNPVQCLQEDVNRLSKQLPMTKVHEIIKNLQHFPPVTNISATDASAWADILAKDVTRTLARAETGQNQVPLQPADVGLQLDTSQGYGSVYQDVQEWLQRMMVARVFAQAIPKPKRSDRE